MRKTTPLADRFWSKVVRDPETDCWEWTGAKMTTGYGRFYIAPGDRPHAPVIRFAHRFAYELLVGPIPDGLVLDHLCRNTGCVNPAHLEPVTNRENALRGNQGHRPTHCKYGHEWTPENTLVYGRNDPHRAPWRRCRACAVQKQRELRQRRACYYAGATA